MFVLAVDTSSKALSVALAEEGKILGERQSFLGYNHSETLLPTVMTLLRDSGLSLQELDLLACTTGPGSFTGIRIGLASMKTLAWELGKPLLGISSLAALAEPLAFLQDAYVLPVIDARGSRVYSSLYQQSKPLLPEKNRQAASLITDIRECLSPSQEKSPARERSQTYVETSSLQPIYLVGDGSAAVLSAAKEVLMTEAGVARPFIVSDGTSTSLHAAAVARLALKAFAQGADGRWEDVQANYCALSQPERLSRA